MLSQLPDTLCLLARIVYDCGNVIETEQSQGILMAQARCRFVALKVIQINRSWLCKLQRNADSVYLRLFIQIFTSTAKNPAISKQLIRVKLPDGVPIILKSCISTLQFKSSQFDPHSVQVKHACCLLSLGSFPDNMRPFFSIKIFVRDAQHPLDNNVVDILH